MRTFFALVSFFFLMHINSPAWAQTEDEPVTIAESDLAWRAQAQKAGQAGSDSLFVVYELYALSLELQNRHKLSFEATYQQANADGQQNHRRHWHTKAQDLQINYGTG